MTAALADLEIIEGKLLAAVDEMGVVLARTSMSPVIYEVLDFACGICTAEGELIAQSNGLT
jgi:N-methylhydantoinase B